MRFASALLVLSFAAAAQPDGGASWPLPDEPPSPDAGELEAPRRAGEISLVAEQVVHHEQAKLTVGEGHATLRTDDSALTADQIAYDGEKQVATGIGHVAVRLLRGGPVAAIAEVATLKLERGQVSEVFLQEGTAWRKKGIAPEAFLAIGDPDQLKAAGITTFQLTGNHLRRTGDDWELEDAELVPCECDWKHPNWGIRASRATIDPSSERASLLNSTVRVHDVPVLWIPWINLPLTDHQTGLLAPKPTYSALNGFSIEQPVFFALSRSFDLTFTPGYFFGAPRVPDAVLKDENGQPALVQPAYGVQGPRLLSEARWAPVQGMVGRLQVGLLYDRNPYRDPINPTTLYDGLHPGPDGKPLPKASRGLRYEGAFQHQQKLAEDWYTRVDASLMSDGYYFRDVTADVLAREANYQRSTASVFRRTAEALQSSAVPDLESAPNLLTTL